MIELNQPVDMNGVDIPIGTGCLYDEQGNEHEVQASSILSALGGAMGLSRCSSRLPRRTGTSSTRRR